MPEEDKKRIFKTVVQGCDVWSGSVGCKWEEQEKTISN
jgi:hypothetical protein